MGQEYPVPNDGKTEVIPTVNDCVLEARRYAFSALRTLHELAANAGGRGSETRALACQRILEAARVVGGNAEELQLAPAALGAGEVTGLHVVTREQVLAQLRKRREQKGT
jgi:hypothetical protein